MSAFVCKLVVLGDSSVGKTSLIHNYINKEFIADFKATIGADFSSIIENVDGKKIEFQIWDTAGEERFHSVSSTFYRGTDTCILVFDLTNRISFERLQFWREAMIEKGGMEHPDNFPFIIFANKTDLKNDIVVSNQEIEAYAQQIKSRVFFVSAKSGQNIEEGFRFVGQEYLRVRSEGIKSIRVGIPAPVKKEVKESSCC